MNYAKLIDEAMAAEAAVIEDRRRREAERIRFQTERRKAVVEALNEMAEEAPMIFAYGGLLSVECVIEDDELLWLKHKELVLGIRASRCPDLHMQYQCFGGDVEPERSRDGMVASKDHVMEWICRSVGHVKAHLEKGD